MTASLVEAAGTYCLPAAVNRRHGFGPVVDGFLLSRPMGEVRVSDRLTHPRGDGVDHFDARSEATQEEAALALAPDPRGHGNPDEGRRQLVTSTALEADPAPGSPDELHVFAVRYGSPGPFAPTFEYGPAGLTIHTEAFTALIGNPAGDARGEPALELRRR